MSPRLRKIRKEIPDLQLTAITGRYASTGNMIAYAATFRSRPRALALGFQIYELKPHPTDQQTPSQILRRYSADTQEPLSTPQFTQ